MVVAILVGVLVVLVIVRLVLWHLAKQISLK